MFLNYCNANLVSLFPDLAVVDLAIMRKCEFIWQLHHAYVATVKSQSKNYFRLMIFCNITPVVAPSYG